MRGGETAEAEEERRHDVCVMGGTADGKESAEGVLLPLN